ncbi:MAG TPA: membrane protein insertion efficiency factor YidD [Microcoleaceae cyanobacterium]
MSISTADSLTRQTAVTLISFYQKRLSPHKGFACAYRVLYGNESCSQYIKRTIQAKGLWQSLPLIRERFQACKSANQILQRLSRLQPKCNLAAIGNEDEAINEPLAGDPIPEDLEQNLTRSKLGNAGQQAASNSSGSSMDCSGCEVLECADCSGLDCSGLDCNVLDHGHHCVGGDCSGLDCSGLDCGALDCGGCSW